MQYVFLNIEFKVFVERVDQFARAAAGIAAAVSAVETTNRR
jgi:hypothetical protein